VLARAKAAQARAAFSQSHDLNLAAAFADHIVVMSQAIAAQASPKRF
jgi:ABC-type hemin transport system ATPase subunit